MARTLPSLPLEVRRALRNVGLDIRTARLRRRLPAAIVAERADITRATLGRVERGDAGVSVGIYATVLWSLGMGAILIITPWWHGLTRFVFGLSCLPAIPIARKDRGFYERVKGIGEGLRVYALISKGLAVLCDNESFPDLE